MKIGMILILFILLVIVTQTFVPSIQSEEEEPPGVLYTQRFNVYNYSNYTFFFVGYSGTNVNPVPHTIPRVSALGPGQTSIELPLSFARRNSAGLFFNIVPSPPLPGFPENAQLLFDIACYWGIGRLPTVYNYRSTGIVLRFTSTDTSLNIYNPY
ncbi:hypothetical protein SAMN05444162_2459 [Paenibacillaceae bacterium GAS479]|nr:hypothetical protein SAMN05444162_2459 [Paenibacillaceae bacterium GAS479]